MKKIDLHQDLILSFENQLQTFSDITQHQDTTGRFSGGKAEYDIAEVKMIFSALRPYEIVEGVEQFPSSMKRLTTLLDQVNLLAKISGITAITTLDDYTNNPSNTLQLLHHIEGMDFVDSLEKTKKLKNLGMRSFGFVWKYDNHLAGCSYTNTGISELGKETIAYLNNNGCIIDTAHMSHQSMMDAVEYSTKPVINSHSNLLHFCSNPRNVSDTFIEKLIANGGTLGLSVYSDMIIGADQDATVDDYIDQLTYLINKYGSDHISLGTDFHGLRTHRIVTDLRSVQQLTLLEERIIQQCGYTVAEKFFYKNIERVIKENLT